MTQRVSVRLNKARLNWQLHVFGECFTTSFWDGEAPQLVRRTRYVRADAAAELERRLAALMKNGFTIVERNAEEVAPRTPPHVDAQNLELEEACRRAPPSEPNAWRVYADWLQTQGDVRGQFAALVQAGQASVADQQLGETDAQALFGKWAPCVMTEITDWQWEHGFWSAVSLKRANIDSKTDLAELTSGVLALPIARFVHSLRFGLASFESDNDWSRTMQAVCSAPQAPSIRSLRFDDYTPEDCEISWTGFGDFSFAWPRLPNLEVLEICAGMTGQLGTLALPKLKRLVRQSGGLAASEVASITAAACPQLEHLEVWFGQPRYGAEGTAASVEPWLRLDLWPQLRHLGIVNSEFVGELLEPLLTSPRLPTLTTLSLANGTLGDEHLDVLLRHRQSLRHLHAFDLSGNYFSADAVERLNAVLSKADLTAQRTEDDYDGAPERYAAVGE